MVYADEYEEIKKKLSFNFQEERIIKKLDITPEAFLPLVFSVKFGGDWSFKTESLKVLAVKDKLTRYDQENLIGYTIETIFLFINPRILNEEGLIHRLEKCGDKKEREIVERPLKIEIDADDLIKAIINPVTLKITVKHVKGPITFEGSSAYGISHEMNHLLGVEVKGKSLWDFKYELG